VFRVEDEIERTMSMKQTASFLGGNTFFRNVGKLVTDKASNPTNKQSLTTAQRTADPAKYTMSNANCLPGNWYNR
jgi:hypothetical protein